MTPHFSLSTSSLNHAVNEASHCFSFMDSLPNDNLIHPRQVVPEHRDITFELNNTTTNKQQQQRRKTRTLPSLSLKHFRTKPSLVGRHSLPSMTSRKKKDRTTSMTGGLFSSFSLSTTTNPMSSYRLEPFSFESNLISHSSSLSSSSDSIHSSSSTASMLPLLTTSSENNNNNLTTYPVGQLLFGTSITNDPTFFEKELDSMIDYHQPRKSESDPLENNNDDDHRRRRQGLLLLKTLNLQRLMDDCTQIEQLLHELNDDMMIEWSYTNCHRIFEQYNRLLVPDHHPSSVYGSKTNSYLLEALQERLDCLEKKMIDDDRSTNALADLVQALKQLIYQGILLTNDRHMVIPSKNHWIEGMNENGNMEQLQSQCMERRKYIKVDHRYEEASWYSDFFVGHSYFTFVGYQTESDPVVLTIVWDEDEQGYRCILRSGSGCDLRRLVKFPQKRNYTTSVKITEEWQMAIEATLGVDLDQLTLLNHSFVVSTGIEQDLLRLDHNLIQTQFKCGVLCIKDGQSKEEDWFSNENTSNSFTEFLDCLGEKITLKGYHGWAAGLDTKSGDSGEYTIKSKWQDQYEVVYHISTWIPSLGDKQHIQRKRHIGNDVVCIVFVDGHQPFDPAAIKSQFLHVFIVVHQEEWDGDICWRVEVTGIKDVPLFGPPLTKQQMFFDKQSLHDFLLAKVINAEYAATLKSSKFTNLLDRARQGTLMNVVNSALKNHHPIGKQKSFIQPSSFFKDFISDRRRSTQDAFSGSKVLASDIRASRSSQAVLQTEKKKD